jgi:hypothetical protein
MVNIAPQPIVCAVDSYRRGIQAMIAQTRPTLFVTLAFNRQTSLDAARAKLGEFQRRMDHAIVGRNWAERPDRRTTFVAVAEHVDANLHIHAAFVVPLEKAGKFNAAALVQWPKLVEGGSILVELVNDPWGLGRYMAKEITPTTGDRLILSPQRLG